MNSTNEECSSCEVADRLNILFDMQNKEAYLGGRPLELTDAEFRLLKCLVHASGRCLRRDDLLDALTGGEAVVSPRAIDVHICSLRRKLGKSQWIQTVRGIGYLFRNIESDDETSE